MEAKQCELDSCHGRWRIVSDEYNHKYRIQVFYNGDSVSFKYYEGAEEQAADYAALQKEITRNYYIRPKNIYDLLYSNS